MNRPTWLLALCTGVACATSRGAPSRALPAAPNVRIVPIAPRVSLEVVDWGGRGAPLVLLAGAGNTAHVFDDFAPRLADSYHVLGITRRGFGASAGAPPPSALDTLVADIVAVLDTLGLERVTLVGHSIAGEEMTRFAELHERRCASLVYLDAAYDRSGIDTLARLQPPAPAPRITPTDTTSFVRIRALYTRLMGVRVPDSDIRATLRFDARDRYRGKVTADSLAARLTSGARVARYDQAGCRALAIYAVPDSVADVVPYYRELDAGGRAEADTLLAFVKAVVADSRARVARWPNVTIVDLHGGNHYVFLQRPAEVVRAMRVFLASVFSGG